MMLRDVGAVNGRRRIMAVNEQSRSRYKAFHKKIAGPIKARLRYWPKEADTITFQEGLLSFRATGGGGQMRNA
jgi:hypothetical protein